MTWHPSEEDLILHRYGDAEAGETDRMDAHLAACPACRREWQDLAETLALVDGARVPEPRQGFEADLWGRLSRRLPARRRARWSAGSMGWVAGWAAAVALMTGAGFVASREMGAGAGRVPETAAGMSPARASAVRERVLLSALNDHFRQTEVLLVELLNAPDTETAELDFERASADDLLASGRLYRQTARQTGDVRLTEMLDDLEGVLVEVARSPQRVGPREVDAWRSRIDDNGLLFKVRAVNHEIRDRQHVLMTESE
jgi:hypothetical protein